jgi:hypothetical protein
LDDIARHEAYHAFQYHTVEDVHRSDVLKSRYPDNDSQDMNGRLAYSRDELPSVDGGPATGTTGLLFQYTLDKPENKCGFVYGYDAKDISQRCPIKGEYKGDAVADEYDVRVKDGKRVRYSIHKLFEARPYDPSNNEPVDVEYRLNEEFPNTPIYDVGVEIYFRSIGRRYFFKETLEKDNHYYVYLYGLKTHPEVQIKLDSRRINEFLRDKERRKRVQILPGDENTIYIDCTINHSAILEEYDASRVEPGEYTGYQFESSFR